MNTHLHPSRRTLVAVVVVLAISAMGGLGVSLARAQTSVGVAENGAGHGAISTYALGGGATPTRRITGPLTGLASPLAIAVDRSGNYYVANTGSSSITVYGPTATGNVAPLRTIAGPATGLNGVFGIAVAGPEISRHRRGTACPRPGGRGQRWELPVKPPIDPS